VPDLVRRLARLRVPLGFLFALAVLWLAQPTGLTLLWGTLVAGAGEALRFWAAGHLNIQRTMISRRRGSADDVYLRSRTPEEFKIETTLDQKISVEFNQTPLSEVVENLRALTGLPFSYDTAALEAEQVSTARPISEKLPNVSARNALHLILDKAGLSFVIEYDTVRITTLRKSKGRLMTKVFSVADLVTPVPNFALPERSSYRQRHASGR